MNSKKNLKCWWCGANANSKEHIIKKADIKRVYGNPPYSNQNQPFIANGPIQRFKVQGPNSIKVKFNPNLCSNCNNSRSSRFDRAYDKFVVNVKSHYEEIIKSRKIDLFKIYGRNWKEQTQNLIKYYVKHVGCRLSYQNQIVPENLINYLNESEPLKDIIFEFELRPLNKAFEDTSNDLDQDRKSYEVLNVGQMAEGFGQNINSMQKVKIFTSWITTGWISINYVVQNNANFNGEDLYTSNQFLPVFIDKYNSTTIANAPEQIDKKLDFFEELNRFGTIDTSMKFYQRLIKKTVWNNV